MKRLSSTVKTDTDGREHCAVTGGFKRRKTMMKDEDVEDCLGDYAVSIVTSNDAAAHQSTAGDEIDVRSPVARASRRANSAPAAPRPRPSPKVAAPKRPTTALAEARREKALNYSEQIVLEVKQQLKTLGTEAGIKSLKPEGLVKLRTKVQKRLDPKIMASYAVEPTAGAASTSPDTWRPSEILVGVREAEKNLNVAIKLLKPLNAKKGSPDYDPLLLYDAIQDCKRGSLSVPDCVWAKLVERATEATLSSAMASAFSDGAIEGDAKAKVMLLAALISEEATEKEPDTATSFASKVGIRAIPLLAAGVV